MTVALWPSGRDESILDNESGDMLSSIILGRYAFPYRQCTDFMGNGCVILNMTQAIMRSHITGNISFSTGIAVFTAIP